MSSFGFETEDTIKKLAAGQYALLLLPR